MRLRELNNKYDVTNIRWGIVRTQNLSNELDSATVILTHIPKINIEPFDIVELTNENNQQEYWLVGNCQKSYVTYTAPFIFDYTVDLVSLTKLLEMDSLPSMAITNIGQNRNINYYIDMIYKKYFKSINQYKNSLTLFTNTTTNSVISKEYVFQEPTMREFFDSLYSQVSAIAKLKIHKIVNAYVLEVAPFYLKAINENLPIEFVNNIEGSYSMDNYITSLKNTASIINPIETVEYHSPISSEIVSNTDNVKLFTNNKIYDIAKFIVKNVGFKIPELVEVKSYNNYYQNDTDTPVKDIRFNINYTVGTGSGQDETPQDGYSNFKFVSKIDLDLTDYIVPLDVFNTLQTLESKTITYQTYQYYNSNYKNNTLYFNRGENTIDNLVYYESKQGIRWQINDEPAVINAILCAAYKYVKAKIESGIYNYSYESTALGLTRTVYVSYFMSNPTGTSYENEPDYPNADLTDWANNYKSLLFKIQYRPYVDTRYTIDKDKNMHLACSVQGASNVNTDISLSIKQSVEKVKQLANDNLIMTGFSNVSNSDYTPVFKIGQKYYDEDNNEYVLTTLEWQTNKSSIIYKGTLSKNYASNIMNTMINREKRYYALANVSNMIDRHEIIKRELVISIAQTAQLLDPRIKNNNILLNHGTFVQFYTRNDSLNNIASGSLPVTTIKTKDLIVYNFNFKDNVSFGEVITDTLVVATNGGYINQIKKYVDDNGEIAQIWYSIGTESQAIDKSALAKYNYSSSAIPSIETVTYNVKKDNRERLVISHQIQINVESNAVEFDDVNWDLILKNGGLLSTYPAKGYFYQNDTLISTEQISDIFYFDYNITNTTRVELYLVDLTNQEHHYLTINIPADYTGSLYLNGELNDID